MLVTYAEAIAIRDRIARTVRPSDRERLMFAACNAVLYGTDRERRDASHLLTDEVKWREFLTEHAPHVLPPLPTDEDK
jgi:hypothetical protein